MTGTRATLLLCLACAAITSLGLTGLVHGAWEYPYAETDPPHDHVTHMAEVRAAINAATANQTERRVLEVIAWRESRFALHIQWGRCSEVRGPKGCDSGKAHGLWQLHTNRIHPVIPMHGPDALEKQARIAIAQWRFHRKRCGSIVGAFEGYATGWRCEPSDESKRRAGAL